MVSGQPLARQTSVEDDAVTTRSNSDDEHQPSEIQRKSGGQQGHILDSYTKIWETYPRADPATVGGARTTSLKSSPIIGF